MSASHKSDIKKIQAAIGTSVLEEIKKFALKTEDDWELDIEKLETDFFQHINHSDIKQAICETYYGARWLYRLGVVFIEKNKYCNAAHIRTQLIDYSSICEALLADAIIVCIQNQRRCTNDQWKYTTCKYDRDRRTYIPFDPRISWNSSRPLTPYDYLKNIQKMTFQARIEAARNYGVIDDEIATDLHRLRDKRNSVHLTRHITSGNTYYLSIAKNAHRILFDLNSKIRRWKENNSLLI